MSNLPVPSSAMARIPEIRQANLALISAFEGHSDFKTQYDARKGKLYFMWDFAQRTNAMFQSIEDGNPSPTAPGTQAQKEEVKTDAVGRCMLIWTLIKDTSGKSDLMFQEEPGKRTELGEGVERAAERITEIMFEGA